MDRDDERGVGGEGDEPSPLGPGADDELELIPLDEPEEIEPPAPRREAPPARRADTPEKPGGRPETAPPPTPAPGPLVRPGLGGARAALVAGVLLLVGAMVAAAVRISGLQGATFSDGTLAVFYVLFQTLLHTMTGFAALLIAAKIAGRELGKAELGAARMLVAVAAFALVANLTIPIPTRLDELFLAAVAYVLIVWGANRLPRMELGVVVVAHALLLIAVALGSLLDGAYTEAKRGLGPPVRQVETPAEAAPGQGTPPEAAP